MLHVNLQVSHYSAVQYCLTCVYPLRSHTNIVVFELRGLHGRIFRLALVNNV
jgi:hypothetical protein